METEIRIVSKGLGDGLCKTAGGLWESFNVRLGEFEAALSSVGASARLFVEAERTLSLISKLEYQRCAAEVKHQQ